MDDSGASELLTRDEADCLSVFSALRARAERRKTDGRRVITRTRVCVGGIIYRYANVGAGIAAMRVYVRSGDGEYMCINEFVQMLL